MYTNDLGFLYKKETTTTDQKVLEILILTNRMHIRDRQKEQIQ